MNNTFGVYFLAFLNALAFTFLGVYLSPKILKEKPKPAETVNAPKVEEYYTPMRSSPSNSNNNMSIYRVEIDGNYYLITGGGDLELEKTK